MNIEAGDYFVVVRGFKLNDVPFFFPEMGCQCGECFQGNEPWQKPTEKEPQYDRSYAGCVFQATAISGPMVSSRLIFVDSAHQYKAESLNKVIILNTNEVELWTVGRDFMDSLR